MSCRPSAYFRVDLNLAGGLGKGRLNGISSPSVRACGSRRWVHHEYHSHLTRSVSLACPDGPAWGAFVTYITRPRYRQTMNRTTGGPRYPNRPSPPSHAQSNSFTADRNVGVPAAVRALMTGRMSRNLTLHESLNGLAHRALGACHGLDTVLLEEAVAWAPILPASITCTPWLWMNPGIAPGSWLG